MATGSRWRPRSDRRYRCVGRRQVEAGRVIVVTRPLPHLVAFGAIRPGQDFLQLFEPPDAAAVLRRAGALAGDARGVELAVLGDGAGLHDELVLPAVAEVVFVAHPGPDPGHVGKACLRLVGVAELAVRVRAV